MIDYQKLDRFFNSSRALPKKKAAKASRHTRLVRIMKLLLPCIAAGLLGLLIIYPKLKDDVKEFSLDITIPRTGELEKLHVENTIFHITDKDNKVHNITAGNIDETEPGSKLVKIANPEGIFPSSNDAWINVKAPTGYYDQNTNQLKLADNVTIYHSDGLDLSIPYFTFDFNESFGFSDAPVKASGEMGELQAEGLKVYHKENLIVFTGRTTIDLKGKETIINADKRVEWHRDNNKMIAVGNAVVTQKNSTVKAEKITARYNQTNGQTEIENIFATQEVRLNMGQMDASGESLNYDPKTNTAVLKGNPAQIQGTKETVAADSITYYPSEQKAVAVGNVTIFHQGNKVFADNLVSYFKKGKNNAEELDKIEVFGNVKVAAKEADVKADKGTYTPQTGIIKLYENVVINQKGNFLKGDLAESDLNTGVSKLLSNPSSGGRVSGVFKLKAKE